MSNIYAGLKECGSFNKTVRYLQKTLPGIVKKSAPLKIMPGKAAIALAVFSFLGIAPTQAADAPPAMIVPGQMNVSAAGAFTYTVPIAVPPGTAGMVPALSLDYSSQSGDGITGLGWSLSGLPSISRCAATLAQDGVHGSVNYDSNDRFCMDGQRLIAISGTYGANGTEYRTEIDGFSKIISYGTAGTGPAYFKVWTKSGQIMEFGNTADSQILAQGKTTARAWAANKISDTKGNYLTIAYNSATGTDRTTNGEAYPVRIDYTGNAAAGLATYNSVQFVYNTARPDVTPTYQSGSLRQTTVLLTNVRTYQGSTLVSDYRLAYNYGSSTDYSELASLTLCDGSPTPICLAPTSFTWQGGGMPAMTAVPNGTAQGKNIHYGNGNLYTNSGLGSADLDGDGLTDLFVELPVYPWSCPSGGTIYLGTPAGTFTSGNMTVTYTSPYSPLANGPMCLYQWMSGGVGYGLNTLLDADGDGKLELFIPSSDSGGGQAPSRFLKFNGSHQFTQIFPTVPTNAFLLTFTIGDVNGDGRTDILNSPNDFWLNTASGIVDETHAGSYGSAYYLYDADFNGDGCADMFLQGTANEVVFSPDCSSAVSTFAVSNWHGSDYEVALGDFNGDKSTDILVARKSTTGSLQLSKGTGLTTTTFTVPSGWAKYEIITGDWNGDGKTDIALIAPGGSGMYGVGTSHSIWLSTGTGFVQENTISNSNSSDTVVSAASADWNNDGASDIWLQKPSGDTEYLFSYVPEVIRSVSNGLGVTTTVTYDRLNKNGSFYTKGTGATYPTQDLDGPIYAVSRIDAGNGLGSCAPPSMTNCYSSTYSYAGLKADLRGRGIGFSSMAVTDVQTGVVQTTNYRTDFPYIGLISSQTKMLSGVTLNSIANTFGVVTLGSGGAARKFVELQQSIVTSNEVDSTAMPTATTTYAYDCDSNPNPCYGNATQITVSVSDGSSKVTTSTYDNDTTNWFLGRLRTANVESIVGSSDLTRHTSYTYDATTGLLTSEIVEPGASDPSLTLETDYTYDAYGNKIQADVKGCVWTAPTACSATTRTTQTAFDVPTYHGSFATSATNVLSQSESWTYNLTFGQPLTHTGPNGIATSWSYDTFGRATLETRPDGTQTAISYAYCSGVNGGSASCPTHGAFLKQIMPQTSAGAQNGPISITYYDALSRTIAADVEGFDGSSSGCALPNPCWIRSVTQYDDFGRVAQASRPYFITGGTAVWTVNTYDAIGRVTRTTAPDTSYTNYAYHGLTTSVTAHVLRPGLSAQDQVTTTVKNAQGLNASVTDSNNKTTSYVYDAFGNLLTVTDPASNVTTNLYDLRGRKTDSTDPDMGHWTYVYDSYGELYKQTDAKSQVATLTYDALGRTLTRTEADLTSTWTYDTATKGIGKEATATIGSNYLRTDTYDTLGRPSTVTQQMDGFNFTYTSAYNGDGRIDTVTYPSGLVAKYVYTSLGYLSQIKDNSTGTVWWQANARDAELRLTQSMAANGVATTQVFDPNTGLVQQIRAGVADSVFNSSYTFDSIGNLYSRADTIQGYTENFCYDILNRLVNSALGASCTASGYKTFAYNDIGNITSKSDACSAGACTYSYGASAGPHALTSISGTVNGVVNPTYAYDLNGNMTSGAGRSIVPTSYNMPSSIAQGTTFDCFIYSTEHQRIRLKIRTSSCGGAVTSTTYYLNAMGLMSEKYVTGGVTTWRDYIMADGHMVAERFKVVGGSTSLRYFVLDHLGSIAAITDEAGTVVERDSYDAWGKRRNANGTDASCGSITSVTTRGFTGHEELDNICLINANARVYDPVVGRFMTADSVVQALDNLQDLNRYSYVLNNPLSFTDPSGQCVGILGCGAAFATFGADEFYIAPLIRAYPILGQLFVAAASVFSVYCGPAYAACAAGAAAGVAGAEGGHSGDVISAFVYTFAEAAAFHSVDAGLNGATLLGSHTAAVFVANGFVGGTFSAVQGGSFGSGFLAAGVGSLAGPLTGGGPLSVRGAVISAVLGGTASMLGGGKFLNGAVTATFAYAAASLAVNSQSSNHANSLSGQSETSSECKTLNCEYGFVSDDADAQGTQVAWSKLQAQCSGGSLAACTAAVNAQGSDQMAKSLIEFNAGTISAGTGFMGGVTLLDFLGVTKTLRFIFEMGNAFNPDTDLLPEIEAARPPQPPAIIEPVSPLEPPKLPKKL